MVQIPVEGFLSNILWYLPPSQSMQMPAQSNFRHISKTWESYDPMMASMSGNYHPMGGLHKRHIEEKIP